MSNATWVVLLALITILLVAHVLSDRTKPSETVASLYEEGIQAYLEERFPECVEKLEQSLKQYRWHRRNTENCRLKCRHESEASEPLFPVDVEDLRFHEKNIRNTLCLLNCKIKSNGNNDNIDGNIEKIFSEMRPYEYLHLCYYKINDKQKAASAAFTFLVANPDHKVMAKNLKQYSEFPEVDMKEVINFEAKDYVYLYVYGADAYQKKDWNTAINNMEESLVSYLHSEDECRAQCEGPFNPGWYPDFVPAIANHFTYVLKCKRNCTKNLGSLNGEYYDDLLVSHYDYLQYSYFKKGNLAAACQAVASYLLLLSNDESMLSNMRYYQGLPKVQDNFFTPREEAIRYAQRDTYEKRILQFIKNEFKLASNKAPIKVKASKQKLTEFHFSKRTTDLGGPRRFASDRLISLSDCSKLMLLADTFMSTNDGYNGTRGNTSPHTQNEKFEGITVSRVAFLVYIGVLKPLYLRLMLEITEEMKKVLTDRFQIKQELFFSYTHLVCRSALPGSSENRTDFSHMIHADNCNLLKDNVCEKKYPAFYWRDYSAILYLNGDFEGGEFIFSADSKGKRIQSSIIPRCGRMVGFSSGNENLHGVKAVKKGKRCALAVWFTLDPKHSEFDRDVSYHILDYGISFYQQSSIDIGEFGS
ncbi:prolyl 3-hydroxylase 1-like [Euwallacea similis]|uniref:prolyl 3-hydroxylase 1-like n=1 Tax=Euwallacea similis TaxID=1736056 RepID=UPI00344B1361